MTYSVQKVFIAGASDVEEEQNAAIKTINTISGITEEPMQIILLPYFWHQDTPVPVNGCCDPQLVFNQKLADSNIVVLIIGEKYGMGYTEEEAELAIKLNKESFARDGRAKPQIIAFFKRLNSNDDPGEERKKVENLKRRLAEETKVLPAMYTSITDFQILLTHSLYRSVIRFRHSTFKHKALSSFWNLGIAEGHAHHLNVIYPAVDDPPTSSEFWRRRLLPNIVFEDAKAIQKLDKTFRLIGFRSFKFYNYTDIPDDWMYHNRVWLCLPRNRPAQQALRKYSDRCVFKMKPESKEEPGSISWGARDATTSTHVISPLRRYLELQRDNSKDEAQLNWNRNFRNIIAKDYGIISRFSVESNFPTTEGKLKEYFIAGIRGLGTWGAGWFIDRRYQSFVEYEPYEDIQMLVEVTYADGRIRDVKDVSHEAQSYFDKQNTHEHLNKVINEYRSTA